MGFCQSRSRRRTTDSFSGKSRKGGGSLLVPKRARTAPGNQTRAWMRRGFGVEKRRTDSLGWRRLRKSQRRRGFGGDLQALDLVRDVHVQVNLRRILLVLCLFRDILKVTCRIRHRRRDGADSSVQHRQDRQIHLMLRSRRHEHELRLVPERPNGRSARMRPLRFNDR